MTVDEILAELEKRMGALDERTKQAVTLALQLAEQQGLPKWQGENPTWDEWQRMSEEERQAVMDELEQRNRVWLERMRQVLRAEWLLVVDGKVIRYGASWEEYPPDEELEALIQRLGKVPLLSAADPMIEETAWSPTRYPADFYPTLSVTFQGLTGQSVTMVADFDTGSRHTFADAELLQRQGVINLPPTTLWAVGWHLNRPFSLCSKVGRRHSDYYRWNAKDDTTNNPLRPRLATKSLRCCQPQPNCPRRSLPLPRHPSENHFGLRTTSHFGARVRD